MGQIIRAQCARCNYGRTLYTGGGLADWDTDTMLRALPQEERARFQSALAGGAAEPRIFRRAYQCGFCGAIYAAPVVRCLLRGREETFTAACPQCGGTDRTEVDGLQAVWNGCPACGGNVLLRPAGHWD